MKNGLSIKKVADIYAKNGCNVTAACLAMGINRKTFYDWKEKYPKLKALVEEAEEAIIDNAESKLLQHINDGSETSLIFFLKTKGKKRGYIEKVEAELTVNPFLKLMQEATSED